MTSNRAECPHCGSSDMVYVVYGLLGPRTLEHAPPWVRFAGCVVQRHNRECQVCGHRWWDDHPAPSWDANAEA